MYHRFDDACEFVRKRAEERGRGTRMRFILVRCCNDTFGGAWSEWRATCAPYDMFFWVRAEDGVDGARRMVTARFPNAYFSDQ